MQQRVLFLLDPLPHHRPALAHRCLGVQSLRRKRLFFVGDFLCGLLCPFDAYFPSFISSFVNLKISGATFPRIFSLIY